MPAFPQLLRWSKRPGALERSALLAFALVGLAACRDGSTKGDGTLGVIIPPGNLAVSAGCYHEDYLNAPPVLLGCGIVPSLGTDFLDIAREVEVVKQTMFWMGVGAEVFPFDECSTSGNALSLPSGQILIGTQLMQDLILASGKTQHLAAVIAHEWAHQVQFRFRWFGHDVSLDQVAELEADAFSFYYTGTQYGWDTHELDSYLGFVYVLGETNFNDSTLHGGPEYRTAAGLVGLMEGSIALQTGTSKTYQELHDIFVAAIELIRCDGTCALPVQFQLAPPFAIPPALRHLGSANLELLHAVAHGTRSVLEFDVTPADGLVDREYLRLRE